MQPHPILMHTLHDDRNRELETWLTRHHVNHADEAFAASRPRHLVIARVRALLAVLSGFSTSNATGAAAALPE